MRDPLPMDTLPPPETRRASKRRSGSGAPAGLPLLREIPGWLPAVCLAGLLALPPRTAAQAADPAPPPQEQALPAADAAAAKPADPELLRTLQRMESAYDRLESYRADFRQESDTRTLQRRKESSGELFFQKPDSMRWIYRTPERRDIYLGQEQMILYMPDRRSAIRQPLGDALAGAAPARLFLGPQALAETFSITRVDPGSDEPETICLKLAPRKRGGMSVEEILLWVGREDYLPRKSRSRDILGNVTTIHFLQGKTNVKPDPKLFRFEPPPDVEIVENVY